MLARRRGSTRIIAAIPAGSVASPKRVAALRTTPTPETPGRLPDRLPATSLTSRSILLGVAALLAVGCAMWQGLRFGTDPPNAVVSIGRSSDAVALSDPARTDAGDLRWKMSATRPLQGPATITLDDTVVNTQVTDGITQANTKVLAKARQWRWAPSTSRWRTASPAGKLSLVPEHPPRSGSPADDEIG